MVFKKGNQINKGIKRSEEYKLHQRLLKLGKPRKGNPDKWKHTEDTKNRLSENHWSKKGGDIWNKGLKGEEFKKHYKNGMKGLIKEGENKSIKTQFKKGDPELRKRNIENRKKLVLPIKDTSIELKIQKFLKKLNIDFYTHQYMKQIEHGYQCDILIPSMNLVIECDGDYWHKYPVGNEIDHIRTSELIQNGFKVLRLWECEIRKMDVNKFKERLNEI